MIARRGKDLGNGSSFLPSYSEAGRQAGNISAGGDGDGAETVWRRARGSKRRRTSRRQSVTCLPFVRPLARSLALSPMQLSSKVRSAKEEENREKFERSWLTVWLAARRRPVRPFDELQESEVGEKKGGGGGRE